MPLASPPRARGSTFVAMEVAGFPALWLSGWIWNATRWMALFLCAYLVNERTGSPVLVQLVGATFFAPMFVGGLIGGVIADRVDRYRLTILALVVLGLSGFAMAVVAAAGALATWMIYPFVVIVGIGGVVDFTARVALIYEIVGPERSTNAIALESLARSGGNTVGALLGGAIIAALGPAATLAGIGIAYVVAVWAMLRVPAPAARPPSTARTSIAADIRGGFRLLTTIPGLVSLLAVTVVFNLFYFPYFPLIPVFAERMNANAFLAGLLASAPGLGMMIGTLLIAARTPKRRGIVYTLGCLGSFVMLFLFAATPWYVAALAVIFVAGFGQAAFATMQAVLTMEIATDATRGRAMGLLSMAIGSLPIGMLILGGAAELLGPPAAVMASAAVGVLVLALSLRAWPQVLSIR